MKLHYSAGSPFVRKVTVVATELGLTDRIERLPAKTSPIDRVPAIRDDNPLGQVPTLRLDDGTVLFDSRVICEYLDDLGGGRLFGTGPARWRALADQALADGLMSAAVLSRYEMHVRPEPKRWDGWFAGQMGKVADALDRFEQILSGAGDRLDIGTITIGCALGYLDFRYPDLGWRTAHPVVAAWYERFGARPSMVASRPVG